MKLKKAEVIAMFVALGYPKAAVWEHDKLQSRVGQLPANVPPEKVPEEFKALYEQIANSPQDESIDLVDEKGKVKRLPVVQPKVEGEKKEPKPPKPPKEPKPPKPPKPPKAAKAKKEDVPRDEYGCRIGSISEKVNAVVSENWISEDEVVEKTGLTLNQVRGRLYYAQADGTFEMRKRIEYRIPPKK